MNYEPKKPANSWAINDEPSPFSVLTYEEKGFLYRYTKEQIEWEQLEKEILEEENNKE